MGGAVGGVAHQLLPDYTGSAGAYALVGMGAAFAGIVRVPLTSVIMIFEITRDYSIIVPLMISNLMAYFISSRLQEEPIYEALQHQDGIHLPAGARVRESLLMVGNAYQTSPHALAVTETVAQAAPAGLQGGAWPVVDDGGLRGMITAEQLAAAEPDRTLGELVPSPGRMEHLNTENFPHLHPDHPLDLAMQRLVRTGLPTLPVVSRDNIRELRGTISMPDILAAYGMGRTNEALSPEPRGPRRLLARMIVVLAGLALLTGFLNYFLRGERVNRADRYYDAANQLLAKDRIEEAIEQYRNAVSVSHSVKHRLALGMALEKAGRLGEASVYLGEVLNAEPNSQLANLGMARVLAKEGAIDEAAKDYRRAIQGADNPLAARTELIEMLAGAGRLPEAQAELRAALAAAHDNAARSQIAHVMLQYQMPGEAMAVFRDLVRQNRRDAAAYDGLGEAEAALGNDRAACSAFRSALRIDPQDALAASRACR
jgi:tetratricopeptide (TPR) repeat protein